MLLAPVADGLELTGTAAYARETDNRTQLKVLLTFLPSAAQAAAETAQDAQAQSAPAVEISIIPADAETAQQTENVQTAVEAPAQQSAYLVGSAPLGLNDYAIPAEMTTVNLDSAGQEACQILMAEAAQRLAGGLILAVLDLPAEDRAIAQRRHDRRGLRRFSGDA